MVLKKDLTREYLRECFDYDPDTGIPVWKIRPREHFLTERGWKIFNKRYALKPMGYPSQDGYMNVELDKIAYRLHILIWIWMSGEHPNKIDHENGFRSDNTWLNLRNVSSYENAKNAKRRKDNTSGVTGVTWMERLGKWQVSIYVNKKNIYLGVYESFEEAVKVRKEAEIEHGFHPNHGREEPIAA